MTDLKRTYVTPAESIDARDRDGFVSVESYGAIPPEVNEVGAIIRHVGRPRLERGMWVYHAEFTERIFLKETS